MVYRLGSCSLLSPESIGSRTNNGDEGITLGGIDSDRRLRDIQQG
jgi:hypothetical protein